MTSKKRETAILNIIKEIMNYARSNQLIMVNGELYYVIQLPDKWCENNIIAMKTAKILAPSISGSMSEYIKESL